MGKRLKKINWKTRYSSKKAMRAMTGTRYNDPSSPLFKRLSILKLKDLFEQQIKLIMYDFVKKVSPEPLLGIYEYHEDIHGHETRHSTDPKPPNANTELMRLYKGPCIWLALDMHIKSSNSRNVFKKRTTQTYILEY